MVLTGANMATQSEIIDWFRPVEMLPDDDTTVLVITGGEVEVWPGFLDGDVWRSADGFPLPDVLFWAHMPEGPEQ
jgi:hypothetical protein